eukprot:PhF_6_TR26685/c0_g1_i2/m.38861/K00106/XDH; xanthine dehydrogenase/oxidase
MSSAIQVTINGTLYTINPSATDAIDPKTTLAQYIRAHTPFKGTKVSCHEGGCGACMVSLTYVDPVTNKPTTRAVNSCLRPLYSCNGMTVTTVQGLGSSVNGYHPIQQRLADLSGTQCGYCSPGMVMTLYSLLSRNPNPTQLDVERELDGNLCRCTGYRPILDTYKSFATASHEDHEDGDCKTQGCKRVGLFKDIEDMTSLLKPHDKYTHVPPAIETKSYPPAPVHVTVGGATVWQDIHTEQDLQTALSTNIGQGKSVMLVGGRTSLGIYPTLQYDVMLNIADIPSLRQIKSDPATGITVGGMAKIAELIEFLKTVVPTNPPSAGAHIPQLLLHLNRVAGHAIRNAGAVAGNLMLAQQHPFPSDVFITLMGLGSTINVIDTLNKNQLSVLDMTTFVNSGSTFNGKYISSIFIPWGQANETYMSYKIAIRQVMSHAIVNASMRCQVDPATQRIIGTPTVCYGGIFPKQARLTTVETAMVGVSVTDTAAFQNLLSIFQTALNNIDPAPGRLAFRKSVALGYFYKFFLSLQPTATLPSNLKTAVQPWFVRPVTKSSQAFQPNPNMYPDTKPMPKLEAIAQTSGEAIYTNDLPTAPGTLYAAVVLSPIGNCTLDPTKIDTTAAKAMPGFVTFYCATDIDPTVNQKTLPTGEIFCSGNVLFAGQIVGVVLATSADAAKRCADAVVVPTTNAQPPILTSQQAVAANSYFPQSTWPTIPPVGDVNKAFASAQHVYSGTLNLGNQQHFHLENQASVVTPTENGGYDVQSATQLPGAVHSVLTALTGLPMNKINVSVKRCGGGFGGKLTNSITPATIATFCSKKQNKPISILVDMQDSMKAFGCREDYYIQYKVGFNNDATIVALQATINTNCGAFSGSTAGIGTIFMMAFDNCYNIPNWSLTCPMMKTNLPAPTPTRGPGWISATFSMENIIASVASQLNVPLDTVRVKNFYKRGDKTPIGMVLKYWNMDVITAQLKESCNYDARVLAVQKFNAANSWVKRGISFVPARFPVDYQHHAASKFQAEVSVYPDGSVVVRHGGVEIGQGINTKVAQATAYAFGITVSQVQILVNDTNTIPNPFQATGGSISSELCSNAAMLACNVILERLTPFRAANKGNWVAMVSAAVNAGVSLTAQGVSTPPAPNALWWNYNSYSAAVSEVELDVLTGMFEIKRTDILFDCGMSMNATIDIGQVEGGFMFGVGHFTQELVSRDPTTGANTTAGTWEYKPPSAFDIPEVFNVTLLRDAPNPVGILGSKASGEPPVSLATSVFQALEEAITAARIANGISSNRWVSPTMPMTVDVIQQAIQIPTSKYVL